MEEEKQEREQDVLMTTTDDNHSSSSLESFQSFLSSFQEDLPNDEDESSSNASSSSSRMLLDQILFFGAGLGSSLGYIATLSSLVYFKLVYGPNSFVHLNLAVYLPLLPISLAQAKWDQQFDQQYDTQTAFLVRGIVAFGLILLGTIHMMIHPSSSSSSSSTALIFNAFLQGTGGAILYGTLNQMTSFVGHGRGFKAMVSAGIQVSALVVLAVSTITGFGTHNASKFPLFLRTITVLEGVCLVMFLMLLLTRPSVTASMTRRDSSISPLLLEEQSRNTNNHSLVEPLVADSEEQSPLPLSSQEDEERSMELTFAELWSLSRSCCLVLIVTLVPSFLVGAWFTRVETNWLDLAQVLFYVRIGADFFGRLFTIVGPPQSIACLSWTAGLRLVPVMMFFWNSRLYGSDILSIVLVGIVAFLSGYLVTRCFQFAPSLLPRRVRAANLAKQASLLTVFFAIAAIGGLLSSFVLMSLGV